MINIAEGLRLFTDTCNVYIIQSDRDAVLIDFGSGDVLDELGALGVDRVTDVLMTHHHRDQGQGLPRAVEAGARIWVPHVEQDLFREVDAHWQAREVCNSYNNRQDRFSLLEPVKIAGTLHDYATYTFGTHAFTVVPTPGHTTGSITLLTEIGGKKVAFSGDLIAGPGKVWSLAAAQWTYNGVEGVLMSIPSLLDIQQRGPEVLLPSHGHPIAEPASAIGLLIARLRQLLEHRRQDPCLFGPRQQFYTPITPHLLRNSTSFAYSYVLLSRSGKALLIDFGYDLMLGLPAGFDRASRRPWLYTLDALKRDFGAQEIDVVVPTHYHDDHVAGCNLLREVEGTQVWAAENFADILEHPADYDLPCLWYDPIPVDRVLPLACPIAWEEYELTLHGQPGHTLHAVTVAFEVDGKRVVAIGDQYHWDGETRWHRWNYVYKNRFRISDYRATAELYLKIQPDLIIAGHWDPLWVQPGYLEGLRQGGEVLERLHRDLLPLEQVDLGAEGFGARIHPYLSEVRAGEALALTVEIMNPYARPEDGLVQLVVPKNWGVEPERILVRFDAHGIRTVTFHVRVPAGCAARRARIAADLTVGDTRFGQQAEALVSVRP